jgi:hypothetical protein
VELEGLLPEHGREDVVWVVDNTEVLDQALLPTRELASHQQVLLVARIKGSLQVGVLGPVD